MAFSIADLSRGKEAGALGAVNHYNIERLAPFEYIGTSEPTNGLFLEHPSDQFPRINRPKVAAFEVFFSNPIKKWALRTKQSVSEDAVLFEYAGELSEDNDKPMEQDDYLFTFDYQNRHFLLDATRRGNLARFINHSCLPNCHTRLALIVDDAGGECGGDEAAAVPHLFICASRQIVAGDELTLDYGDAWWRAKRSEGTFFCECGRPQCRYKRPTK